MNSIRLGTSAFTATGWEGAFYPNGMQPRDVLTCYATRFDTVEVDSTYYHALRFRGKRGGANKTSLGFFLQPSEHVPGR
jgi:uncharacterized protein YecE (DUF72 family)